MPPLHKPAWPFWRLWPLAAIAMGIALFFLVAGGRWISVAELQAEHQRLADFVAERYLLAVFLYMGIYVLAVALSLPGSVLLTLTGGYMFGALPATCYIVVAATTGATILFLAARSALGNPLRARAGPWLAKFSAGFQRDVWSYMLILRLIPVFPFFAVNLVPAFLGVSLRCFVVTTFFGIIPATYVYALLGTGIGETLRSGGNIKAALSSDIVVGLLGLAVLLALPILLKHISARRNVPHD
jgi:uncharacterized membrane protein YdjX (TVP38/TMEM64 family)